MRVLIYSGIAPGVNSSVEDLLTKKYDCGGNIGNLLFINAVAESLRIDDGVEFISSKYRADFTDKEIDWINQKCDYFILPLADAFREDNILQLKHMTQTILKLKIPCIVIGVGLRDKYNTSLDEPRSIDSVVKAFVKAVLEKSNCLGLRGETTARYLTKLGFLAERDFMVIGCPSMCMAGIGEGIKIKKLSLNKGSYMALNGNDLAPDFINRIFRNAITYYPNSYIVQQREQEMIDIYMRCYSEYGKNLFRVPGSLYGKELYSSLLNENRIKYFSNIYSWISFLRKMDFCMNTRFHGTVASIMAGVPSLIIPIDSRMQELVEYHQMPHLCMDSLKNNSDIINLVEKVDFKAPEKVSERNLNRYFSFLEKNSLRHVGKNHVLSYIQTEHQWKIPDTEFANLNFVQKSNRIMRYYCLRLGNRRNRKKFIRI